MGYLSPGQLEGMGSGGHAGPEPTATPVLPKSTWRVTPAPVRADPAACARLVNAKNYYDALKASRACSPQVKRERPGDCNKLTNAYSQWQALKNSRACRAAPASSAGSVPSYGPAYATASSPAYQPASPRLNLPVYTIPKRGPFGFKAARDFEILKASRPYGQQQAYGQQAYGQQAYGQQAYGQQAAYTRRVPAWVWPAAGVSIAALAAAMFFRRR